MEKCDKVEGLSIVLKDDRVPGRPFAESLHSILHAELDAQMRYKCETY